LKNGPISAFLDPVSPAHYLFCGFPMSRPAKPPVLRSPDAWRRDPDDPWQIRPAKIVADNADGTQQDGARPQ
jgi:hypothetical protein